MERLEDVHGLLLTLDMADREEIMVDRGESGETKSKSRKEREIREKKRRESCCYL